jgi:hypothetical protein
MLPATLAAKAATNKYVWIGAGVGLLVALYLAKKTADVVGDVAESVNPFNPNNVINQAAEGAYQWATGSTGTIGGDFYDATHGGRLDPTSDKNYAASAVDWLGEAISGDPGWSLGGKIYDWTH